MSTKTASPTAILLRGSRLFALPNRIARPPSDAVSNQTEASDTPPHPLYASITSPTSSRSRGDWGLKRNLPSKIIRKSEPTVQVEAHDTFDQVTEFSSAARFSKTLRKWQELNMPLSASKLATNVQTGERAVAKSVFEAEYDGWNAASGFPKPEQITNRELRKGSLMKPPPAFKGTSEGDAPKTTKDLTPTQPIWRYKSPWILGMTLNEFKEYLRTDLSRIPKSEFKTYMTACAAKELTAQKSRHIAREDGTPEEGIAPVDPADVTPEEFRRFVQRLFAEEQLLDSTIAGFLDLPEKKSSSDSGSVYDHAITGPPFTHPSAGLSYIRTAARVRNHPTEGPQNNASIPMEARILNPYEMPRKQLRTARFGLAGFVFDGPSRTVGSVRGGFDQNLRFLDIETPGGAHSWVQIDSAQVSNDGTLSLTSSKPRPQAQEAEEVRRKVEEQRTRGRESKTLEERVLTPMM